MKAPVFDSVRGRLAIWHTAVLAVLLASFAVASYVLLARSVAHRDDRFLEESALAFRANIAAERAEVPLDTAVSQSVTEFRLRDLTFLVYDDSGKLMAKSATTSASNRRGDAHADPPLDTAAARRAVLSDRTARFTTVGRVEGGHRLYILPVALGHERITVVAAESRAEQLETLEDTRMGFLIAIPLALIFAWLGGYLLARRSLAPVVAMSERAAEIGAMSLHERLPVANPRDELGQLATTFNALLERLDAAFEQQRRFMADASHELRTPVSIMRGEADVALSQSNRSPDEYRGALEIIHREGRRLSRIVSDLFLLARADAGQQPLQPTELYLDELVSDCVRVVRSIALSRDVTLRCTVHPPVPDNAERADAASTRIEHAYRGDEELLRRVLLNLLDNAIKHSPPHSTVDVRLESDETAHRIRVLDHGAGIPLDAQAHIFERFYRADASHARDTTSESGGAGLGLAIAHWVAEAHGGTLRLESTQAGETVFRLTLPRG